MFKFIRRLFTKQKPEPINCGFQVFASTSPDFKEGDIVTDPFMLSVLNECVKTGKPIFGNCKDGIETIEELP